MIHSSTLIQRLKFKDAEGGDGEGGDGVEDAAAAAAGAGVGDEGKDGQGKPGGDKPSDKEAQLLKEVMKGKDKLKDANASLVAAQEQLKRFEGIDPDAVRQLLQEKADLETAELEKRGEFDRVKAQMVEQHKTQLTAIQTDANSKVEALTSQLAQATAHITELTIGRSFGDSPFVRETLTLTPSKARVVYGSHFELQDGNVVAYDKPAGAENRTVLVDGSGNPLSFDKAIEAIVKADPDHEHLIRSKMKPGAGSNNDAGAKQTPKIASGRDRIAAAVKGGAITFPN